MPVSFELPTNLEKTLREQFANFDQAAKEATLVELYRQQKISHVELSEALGIDRFQAEEVLRKHNVTEDLPTLKDLEQDEKNLLRILGPAR